MRSKPFVRLALRRMMRKNPDQRSEIRQVLRDPDLLDALIEETQALAALELGAIGEGSLMEFFEWLLANADEIFALITKLLILFAEAEIIR